MNITMFNILINKSYQPNKSKKLTQTGYSGRKGVLK